MKAGVYSCAIPYDFEGDRSVVWKENTVTSGHIRVRLTIGSSAAQSSLAATKGYLESLDGLGWTELNTSHENWWHSFYPKHFYTIPDTRLESLYWIGIHRIGVQYRPGGVISDNYGLAMYHDAT